MPKLILTYGLNYTLPLGDYAARLTITNTYRSGYYQNDNHASFTYQDAYNISNLGLGFGAEDRNWEVSLLVRNLFDKEYYNSASTWSNSNAQSVTYGAPRTWLIFFRSRL